MKKIFAFNMIIALILILGCGSSGRTVRVDPVMDIDIPESQQKVISVSKFVDRSIKTKDFAPWEQGIPEMIMDALGAIPYYKVISRDYTVKKILDEQSFQLIGATDQDSVVELGKLLNAQFIVLGSFSVFHNTIQINAKVVSVETGQLIVQASKVGSLNNFYVLQNSIAIKITEGMNFRLNRNAKNKLMKRYDTRIVAASLANYSGQKKLEEIQILEKRAKVEKRDELKKKAKNIKEEAKQDFKKALNHDTKYEKARKNLSKLSLAIPMTL